jgi:hypothetical protein
MSLSDNLRRLARERVPTGAGPVTPPVYTNDPTLTEAKAFASVLFLERFLDRSDDELFMQVRDLQTSY